VGAFSDLFARLDPDDNIRGKQFERICKWYLQHDPVYAGQLTRVWLWRDWPGRWYPKKEAGIDLVAEHRDGTLWAIQSKAYDPAHSVTKEAMNSFLSESNRPQFSYRLLIATTDRLGSIARNTMNAQAIPVGHLGRTDLDAVEIDWPASPSDLRARRLPPKEPKGHWAYQGEAMNNVVKEFQQADRGKLIMACGTGKTLTALFIREKLAAERTLVLMPSLQLMKQTIGEWKRNKKVDFDFLPVCSDETVSKDDDDMPVSNTSDLGFPVTTDPEEIATFLRRRSGPRVVFATYQSSPEIAKAFKMSRVPAFDLAIADEAHRCAAPHSSEFATILDNEKIKAHRRLFMTATPRIYSARVLTTAKEAGYDFASMDDEEKFGKVFHRLSFRQAIEHDLLTDYQVAIIGVDNATYRDWAEKAWFITIDGKEVTDAREVAGQIGLAKAMRRFDLRRVITFHRLRKRAKEFAASLPEVIDWMPRRQRPNGKLWTAYVDGTMPADDRHRRLQSLSGVGEGERGLISNARCLTEGIDVPTLDGVAFIDPKRSEIDIAQAVGRAIRLADAKTIGTIVIPVFIDTDEPNPDVVLDDSAFKPVWDVLLALRSHDEELAQQLDDLRRMRGRLRRGSRGPVRLPDKIHTDIPDVCGVDFARAFDVHLVEQTTASWEFWYGLLERYVTENGTSRVPQSRVFDGFKLGQWVTVQRSKWETLSDERRQRLKRLPGWILDVHADQWEEGFRHLQEYVAEQGTARIRDDYVADDGYSLGRWVGKQRTKWESLTDERRQRLLALPGWIVDARVALWEDGFRLLKEYARQNGHANPQRGYVVEGVELESWVRRQRRTWDSLSEDRRQRLGQLPGWTLDVRADKWEAGFRRLQEYIEEYGDAQVPQSYVVGGYALGKWLSVQRRTWESLSEERRQRLGQLPGWTLDARGEWWEEGFGHLQRYVEEHGNARIPQTRVFDKFNLGLWVANQRSRWDILSDERRERLRGLPGWTLDAKTAFWEEGFQHLKDFADANDHTRVPQKYIVDGFKLGVWMNTQRTNWSKLSEERRQRLSQVPGWTLNTISAQWEEGFNHLVDYVAEHGDSLVRSDCMHQGFRLGQWVTVQRRTWDSLSKERQKRLGQLPGWAVSARTAWWEEGFRRLQEYVRENGHASPPQSYTDADGYALGVWVNKQRQSESKGNLSPERRKRLVGLPGWEWVVRDSRWEEGFRRLQEYIKENGHPRPSQAYVTQDGYSLGAWVNMQRHNNAKGFLEPDQQTRLDKLKGWEWSPRDAAWEEGYLHLQEHVKKHRHACPPQSYVDDRGYRLGTWVSQQRHGKTKGSLSSERQLKLNKLKGWEWNPPRGAAAQRR
jgi:superfamily II DNA or RNA helicase